MYDGISEYISCHKEIDPSDSFDFARTRGVHGTDSFRRSSRLHNTPYTLEDFRVGIRE